MLRVYIGKEPYQYIADKDEGNRCKPVPEELDTPVKVRFREYYMPRQDETRREAEAECNDIGTYFRGYLVVTIYMHRLPVDNIVDGYELDKYV